MFHLLGGGVWVGGLIGLVAIALPGALPATDRAAFWSPVIRRFSVTAMSCVGAIALSGLWLYWEHVDGPTQLFTTMYGRVLGVKILIFTPCCCWASTWVYGTGETPAVIVMMVAGYRASGRISRRRSSTEKVSSTASRVTAGTSG